MKVTIKDLITKVSDNIAFPKVAMKILRLFEDDNLSAYQLAKAISLDPVLAAYVLKVSNSAFYNFANRVKNLSDAIALIGFEEVKKVVVMVSTKSVFSSSDFFDRLLWEHSLGAAIAASVLNEKLKITDEGSSYIMGLLHDIGKVVFKKADSEKYTKLLKDSYDNDSYINILEDNLYGYNHADVGSYLLETWNFEQGIIDAVGFHHLDFNSVNKDFLKKAALVNLSDFIINLMGIGKKEPQNDLTLINTIPSARFLDFYEENPIDIVNDIYKKFSSLKETFE